MLVHDVSSPVILSREGFTALSRVRAIGLRAVKLPCLVVLVINVAIKMSLGAKSHGAPRMSALMWPVMIALMVIEFVYLVKHTMTLIACKRPR